MVICYSHTIDLVTIKSNMISTEAKTLLKVFCKSKRAATERINIEEKKKLNTKILFF